jgi:uncharacterized protein
VVSGSPTELASVDRQYLLDRLASRLKVEDYFRRSGRTLRKSRFRLWFNRRIKAPVLKLALQGAGLYGRGVRNAIHPVVRRIPIFLPDLPPAFDGFEILHLSDFHIDEIDGLTEALSAALENLRPDLCVLTGDYRYEITGPCREVYPRMRTVLAAIHARHGTVGILGNHDAAEMVFRFEELGVRMLVNDALAIEHNHASLWLVGLDDQFDYCCADLAKALCGVPADSFKVLLSHDPQLYRQAAAGGVHLFLCGHTHAGQLRLPLLGPVKKNAPVPRRLVQGLWSQGRMQGYTTWGVGCSTLPVRFNCPPEIALLELHRTAEGGR